MTPFHRWLPIVLAAPLFVLPASGLAPPVLNAAAPRQGPSASDGSDLDRDLERIREVTRGFHDLDAAEAVGYPATIPDCIESPAGGMGYHFVHPDRLDEELDVEAPEILVYAPTREGTPKLAGVEYVVPYPAWDRPEAPRILGQALKRSDELQIWYLHVWVWESNVNGVFADWNPAVSCTP